MNYLKIKSGLFSLLAILAVSVFLTSCEQESFAPQQIDEVNLPTAAEYLNSTPDLTSMPDVNSVPEITPENTAEGTVNERGGCVVAGAVNNYPPLGSFYAYPNYYTLNGSHGWVYSYKYGANIYMGVADICDLNDVTFYTNASVCGKIGWIYKNNTNILYNWNGFQWVSFWCH